MKNIWKKTSMHATIPDKKRLNTERDLEPNLRKSLSIQVILTLSMFRIFQQHKMKNQHRLIKWINLPYMALRLAVKEIREIEIWTQMRLRKYSH